MYTVNAYSRDYYRCIYEEVFTTLNKREIRIYIGALVGTHAAIKIGKKKHLTSILYLDYARTVARSRNNHYTYIYI